MSELGSVLAVVVMIAFIAVLWDPEWVGTLVATVVNAYLAARGADG
jgi:hypothetical protein